MNRHPSRMLVAVVALSLLAACSTAKDTGGESADGKAGSAKSSSAPGKAGDAADNGASGIGIDQPDPSKAIFSKKFAVPGNPKHKVTVGILSLERKDKVAILKVVVTPEFTDLPASQLVSFNDALDLGSWHWTPTMLDLTNLKKYKVLWGTGAWLNFEKGKAENGQPIYAWAVFAVPPADVTKVDLTIVEWMPRLTNVPIR